MSTNPTDWFQHFYQQLPAATPPSSNSTSNGTTPPTTTTTPTSFLSFSELGLAVSDPGPTATASTPHQPSPAQGGRVSKPTRRRQRASKKTPTTLLTTDAANFRSMVQRYTGGPSAYAPPPGLTIGGGSSGQGHQGHIGSLNHHFRFGSEMNSPRPNNMSSLVAPAVDDQLYGAGFSSTATGSSRPSIGFFSVGPAGGTSDQSSSMGGGGGGGDGGQNKRSGFMF